MKLFFKNKKSYLWTHGLYGKENFLEYAWKMLMFKLADHIFVYGDYSADLMRKAGLSENKIHSIHNSLDYETQLRLRNSLKKSDIYSSHFKNNHPVLIFIGRLNTVKRLDLIINALNKLKNEGINLNLVFIGEGPEKKNLTEQVQELSLQNQVWFFGACYDESINAELIYNADLCVAPGNIGLTSIHSLMFGCPAISHNDFPHQMPEFEVIKPGLTGDYFEKDNIISLTDRIKCWFTNKTYDRQKIRLNCYDIIDREWNPNYQIELIKSIIH